MHCKRLPPLRARGRDRRGTIQPSILYFGTPTAVLSTLDAAGRVNLTPMSWALGDRMSEASLGCENLMATGEAVINLPGPAQQAAVERLAPRTGRWPEPGYKVAMGYRHEADESGWRGGRLRPSRLVRPPRVLECQLQLGARLLAAHACTREAAEWDVRNPGLPILELQVVRVQAHEAILHSGSDHVDTKGGARCCTCSGTTSGRGCGWGATFQR